MTIRIKREAAQRACVIFRAIHWVTFLVGAALLASPVMESVESAYTQWSGEMQLNRATQNTTNETVVARTTGAIAPEPSRPRGSVLGRFEIPRLKLSYILLEGADDQTLARSIGHVEGTGGLGESGNVSIAGHRNTHFRKLEWIRRGDEIVLSSVKGKYRYRVEWTKLFKPEDIEVLDRSHGPAVTLITCFPFEYVGSAPMRFVVRALPDPETRTVLQDSQRPSAE